MTDLRLSEPDDNRLFFWFVGQSFNELLRIVTPAVATANINILEVISSQRLSITPRYVCTGNTFEVLKYFLGIFIARKTKGENGCCSVVQY